MLLQPSLWNSGTSPEMWVQLCGSQCDLVFLWDVCASEETFGQEPCKKLFCLRLTLFIAADCKSTDSLGDKRRSFSLRKPAVSSHSGPWKMSWNTDTFYTQGFPWPPGTLVVSTSHLVGKGVLRMVFISVSPTSLISSEQCFTATKIWVSPNLVAIINEEKKYTIRHILQISVRFQTKHSGNQVLIVTWIMFPLTVTLWFLIVWWKSPEKYLKNRPRQDALEEGGQCKSTELMVCKVRF